MEVAHNHGPMCGEKAFLDCPVRRNPAAVIQGKIPFPSEAPPGDYKVVFQGNMGNVRLFCVATKMWMTGVEAAE